MLTRQRVSDPRLCCQAYLAAISAVPGLTTKGYTITVTKERKHYRVVISDGPRTNECVTDGSEFTYDGGSLTGKGLSTAVVEAPPLHAAAWVHHTLWVLAGWGRADPHTAQGPQCRRG